MKRFGWLLCSLLTVLGVGSVSRADTFSEQIRPLLADYCVTCHSTAKQEGELDLERFQTLAEVRRVPDVWERVQEQLALGEMPPKRSRPLPAVQRRQLADWTRQTLTEIALASAGDPGPVVLRRLSNHEYTYTLRDLTGVEALDPAREFPVDGAAGEGFTNAGAALVMSPALLAKYLDAAREVSRHLVLLDSGVRFSPSQSPQDWTSEALAKIRSFYARYTLPTTLVNDVGGTGPVPNQGGILPLARYLDALQGTGDRQGLSQRYLDRLEQALGSSDPDPWLAPLRRKYREKRLTAADIEPWQKMLFKYNTVGHIGRPNGPRSWQEAASPLVPRGDFRLPLATGRDHTLHLWAGTAGDGDADDEVLWENPRLVAKDRPEIPLANLSELVTHLEAARTTLLADAERCLAAIAAGNTDAPAESLAAWREYLGFGTTRLEPLMTRKIERTPDYAFIQGWGGDRDLSVLANSSDNQVRIPGIMAPHSVATHPAPDRAAVIAWLSPLATRELTISGTVTHAHPECGNGITWALEVRRGAAIERLATGVSQGAQTILLGPFEKVRVEAGQVVALVIGPRDGNHACDMTAINLKLTAGDKTWDLGRDVSPNILQSNPHGPWHFVSQPATAGTAAQQPPAVADWTRDPTPANATKLREFLAGNFPLTHPLLNRALQAFRPQEPPAPLVVRAPGVLELQIPATLAEGREVLVTGRLTGAGEGTVQLQVTTQPTGSPTAELLPGVPVVATPGSPGQVRFDKSCGVFRDLFPAIVCYTTIVPIDEVVTLTLYHREDEALVRLLLSDAEVTELDALWSELLFVSEAPLKQVNAFEQIYQFATQDRPDLVKEFEPLRAPTHAAAAAFRERQQAADPRQREALLDFAARAWRRPLTDAELTQLRSMPPRLMLVRILASPAFLYRGERPAAQTAPVNDFELATRLSYFLWSSAPDDALMRDVAEGRLGTAEGVAAAARRMVRDDRVRRLANEFGAAWLHVSDVATLDEKSERHFPEFAALRGDLQEEVVRTFEDLFRNNRPVTDLLDGDAAMLNEALATVYGIPGVRGPEWRRVSGVKAHGRGGVLGMGAVLAKQSGASRTSPILRGNWLCEVLLGDKLPKPPKGVPPLPQDESATEGLTVRQLTERHSTDPKCSGCHVRIDPFGYALEAYDAIGRRRDRDLAGRLLDTRVTLPGGVVVEGMDGLRGYLAGRRRDAFVRQFCRKLAGYALGRSVQVSDGPMLKEMAAALAADGMRVQAALEVLVRSKAFREIRGRDVASAP